MWLQDLQIILDGLFLCQADFLVTWSKHVGHVPLCC